jgi:hypothetical protein
VALQTTPLDAVGGSARLFRAHASKVAQP